MANKQREWKPLKSLSIKAFAQLMGAKTFDLFESKDGESLYAAESDKPHIPLCFVSQQINGIADIRPGAMVSEFENDEPNEDGTVGTHWRLHNAGKESLGSLLDL